MSDRVARLFAAACLLGALGALYVMIRVGP